MTRIAVLGLGAMGSRMAKRLINSGLDVTIWNRDAAKAEPLARAGGRVAPTPDSAVADADIVLSMVTDDHAARAIWLDPVHGASRGLKRGTVVLECSTVSPNWIRELERAVIPTGARVLDAPVAGSLPQAEAGQLLFMIGGEAEDVEAARPALAAMGAKVLHVGALGQGVQLKLAVNAFFAAQLASLAELLGFLGRSGFQRTEAANLLGEFPIVAPSLAGAVKMMAANSTTPLFTIDLIEKDLGYALDAARASGAGLPSAAAARSVFQRAQAAGFGSANVSGVSALFA